MRIFPRSSQRHAMQDAFRDRVEAGQLLARGLMESANQPNVIVLALPRGGVPLRTSRA